MSESSRDFMNRMIDEFMQTSPLCEAYIDQDRMIGLDPVGHKCSNMATQEVDFVVRRNRMTPDRPVMICDRCKALMDESPNRVSFLVDLVREKGK